MATNDFSKLWEDFWTSSIQESPPYARLFFASLWGLCDHEGNFTATIEALARRANLAPGDAAASLAFAKESMKILTSPDPLSTNRAHEGRRVLNLGQNRWHVVSFVSRRDQDDADRRRKYWREKKREQRAVQQSPQRTALEAAEAAKAAPEKRTASEEVRELVLSSDDHVRPALLKWLEYRKERKLPAYKVLGMKGLIAKMERMSDPMAAVEHSISMNYDGVFEPKYGKDGKKGSEPMQDKAKRLQDEVKRRLGGE